MGWRLLSSGEAEGGLSKLEERVHRALFDRGRAVEFQQGHARPVERASNVLRKGLEREIERRHFENNRAWFLGGLAISLLGFGALVWRWRFAIEPAAWFLGLWLTLWTGGVVTLLWRVVATWKAARSRTSVINVGAAIFITLFSVPFLGAELLVLALLAGMAPTHLVLAAVGLGAVNLPFYHLLERPTLRGRAVLDQIEGFRAFLAAERDRTGRLSTAADSPAAAFERYLPHALALGLAGEWATRFVGIEPAPAGGGLGVVPPRWFTPTAPDRAGFDVTGLASALGSGLSSSLSAVSSPPVSSGGGGGSGFSSGGGSSGGGGGGGGGGGW